MKTKLLSLTIFLGSFLIFGIQPMVGRTLLPVFGGTTAVWVACLCAFQVFLLGGYWYADWLVKVRMRLHGHLILMLVASAWTVIVAFNRSAVLADLIAVDGNCHAFMVFLSVLVLVGVPYVLLGSNASLVQVLSGGDYRLYAVSNAGSLLGLLAYPFVFEPHVSLTTQWLGFAVGIALYAILLFVCSQIDSRSALSGSISTTITTSISSSISTSTSFISILYLILPASSCFLLDALTTYVTLDVMPLPLIWTASLGIFLISYIIGFSGLARMVFVPCAILTAALLPVVCWLSGRSVAHTGLAVVLSIYGTFLLVSCTFLHAWLYELRPEVSGLTRYYLFQSIGGAVGGIAASLAFPLLAKTIREYPTALVVTGVMSLVCILTTVRRRLVAFSLAGFMIVLCFAAFWQFAPERGRENRRCVHRGRGFFGTIAVHEIRAKTAAGVGCIREFVHGTTVHGLQTTLPGKRRMPTAYYTPNASGYAIAGHPKYRTGEPMRVNITGLGVGVLFCYGRTNDYYRAYEISENALNTALNTNLFTFICDCPSKKSIVLGDARKGLESELADGVEPYDVIVVDAFTGDNLPYHLSTVEAFDLYFKLLKPDGILCVNISNWHLDLQPFMRAVGDHYECPLMGLRTADNFGSLQFAAAVAIFCRDPSRMSSPPFGPNPNQAMPIDFGQVSPMSTLPTDEKGSFLHLVRW